MTDKQIIIDGCDVSGCENYGETMAKTHNCTLYDEYLRPCKGTDCYYKQLKRKEQECEELKEQLTILNGEDVVVEITVKQFEEYKKLKAENEELKKNYFTVIQQRNKTEQALTEIKEIIQSDYCTEIGSCEFCAEVGNCLNRKILQKISECEVAND